MAPPGVETPLTILDEEQPPSTCCADTCTSVIEFSTCTILEGSSATFPRKGAPPFDARASSSSPPPTPPETLLKKSAKRKATEALLERKASRQKVDVEIDTPYPYPYPYHASRSAPAARVVGPCGRCACLQSPGTPLWCRVPVRIPVSTDWGSVLSSSSTATRNDLTSNLVNYTLPGGMQCLVVSSASEIPAALQLLRDSMADSVIAIDLEWRPDYKTMNKKKNKVALMQLASSSLAVLIRCCTMKFILPTALKTFLTDPHTHFVGYSWDVCDESKMVETFGTGRALFNPDQFIDLQKVCQGLGYHRIGLASLTKKVLGYESPLKTRKIAMSDWEAADLSIRQIHYAALDALLTGHIFRGLRLWHQCPSSLCMTCQQPLGKVRCPVDEIHTGYIYIYICL